MSKQQNGFVVSTPEEVKKAFSKRENGVVTLAGFSGLGYEDESLLQTIVTEQLLNELDPRQAIINIGGTSEGIGKAYQWAAEKGFEVTGIVSSLALEYPDSLSPHLPKENCFFVKDESWGGYLPDTENLSPTSEAIISVSNTYVAFGGGEIALDEMREMKKRGKEYLYYELEMNHEKARAKAKEKGKPEPVHFFGSLHKEFQAER